MIINIVDNEFIISGKNCKFCNTHLITYENTDRHLCPTGISYIDYYTQAYSIYFIYHTNSVRKHYTLYAKGIADFTTSSYIEIDTVHLINSSSSLDELYTDINLLFLFS
jgi:hypothetical protein